MPEKALVKLQQPFLIFFFSKPGIKQSTTHILNMETEKAFPSGFGKTPYRYFRARTVVR